MTVPGALIVVLFVLMTIVGGKRGVKSFFTLLFNFVTLFLMIGLIVFEVDPIKVTVVGSIIISSITLFYINGLNRKTIASLISVTFVVLITLLITYKMGTSAQIQGFSLEQSESISYLALNVRLNFNEIMVCEILLGLLGAIIDVSISISSAMNELYRHNPQITKGSLFGSGVNIGKDILGTMTNTLLFAYIGGFMTLLIWFGKYNYSVMDIINAKVFCAEAYQVLASGIGVILTIPVTAVLTMLILSLKLPKTEWLKST